MNILLVSYLQPDAPSGVRVHYLQLSDLLRRRGHRVDLITTGSLRGWRQKLAAALRHTLLRLGPSAHAMAIEVENFLRIQWSIDPRQPYDLVHAHDVGSGAAASRALGGRVPVVVTGHFNEHPGEELVLQHGLRGSAARRVLGWYNYLLRRTDYFLSVSNYVRRRVGPWLAPHALHTRVYHGIDLAGFARALPDEGLRQLARGRHVLLNVGHLEPRKNQRFLVAVAQELLTYRQDFVVALAGQGPDEVALREQVAATGLQDVVLLLGQRAAVAPLLHASTLYVHTATRESFGLVLLEAMASGVPALALAVGGIPEVLAAEPAALLPADATPAQVARRLHLLLDSPMARVQLQKRQAAYAATHFAESHMAEATLAFYQEAIRHFRAMGQVAEPAAAPSRRFPSPKTTQALRYET